MGAEPAGFQTAYLAFKDEWEKKYLSILNQTSLARSEKKFKEAVFYSLKAGGKRLRPVFSLACADVVGLGRHEALILATAMESLHTYSLVHDDLPAMDDDDLRRGKPTSHVVYGEAVAILVGDALQSLAYELLAMGRFPHEALLYFSKAVGPQGLIGGQFLDIEWTGSDSTGNYKSLLKKIHRKKTGALIAASFVLPSLCAPKTRRKGIPTVQEIEKWAEGIGVLFQIVDDILDCTATPEMIGKSPGKDIQSRKLTYVTQYGLKKSQMMVISLGKRLTREARELFPGSPFLIGLPEYIQARRS